jgi:hypothetical protein
MAVSLGDGAQIILWRTVGAKAIRGRFFSSHLRETARESGSHPDVSARAPRRDQR